MKYRDNMTPEETAKLLAEIEAQDQAYAEVAAHEAAYAPKNAEEADEAAAAWEGSLDYFNRYIAGDR